MSPKIQTEPLQHSLGPSLPIPSNERSALTSLPISQEHSLPAQNTVESHYHKRECIYHLLNNLKLVTLLPQALLAPLLLWGSAAFCTRLKSPSIEHSFTFQLHRRQSCETAKSGSSELSNTEDYEAVPKRCMIILIKLQSSIFSKAEAPLEEIYLSTIAAYRLPYNSYRSLIAALLHHYDAVLIELKKQKLHVK